jgi:hypothetical protein
MAYLDIENMSVAPIRRHAEILANNDEARSFSAIEWGVIAFWRRDSATSLSESGRISRALGGLFGFGANSRHADTKLEALRRFTVHAWQRGRVLPQVEIDQFIEARFTLLQAETLVASVTGDRASLIQIHANPRFAA